MSDILLVIENKFLPQLSEMYKGIPWAPYVYSYIETAMKWKKCGRNELTTFYSPNDCWREDGTFFGLMQFGNHDIFMFTLDVNCTNLCKGILETRIVNWRKPTVLFNLDYRHYPHVMKAFSEMNLNINYCNVHDMYLLDTDNALNFNLKCPPEVQLRPLEPSNAAFIDSQYKTPRHRYPDSAKFIYTLVEMNRGFGLFVKDTNQLVAWVMRTCLGQIGFLQTLDGHYKKGYAYFLLKVVAKQIAEEGFVPMGAVSQSNLASIKTFNKAGFYKDGSCYFLEVNK